MKILANLLCLAVLGPALLLSAKEQNDKKLRVQPRPDSALVYLHRKASFAGGGRAQHVFYDDKLAGVLRNNTYTFVYLPPGTYVFWNDFGKSGLCDVAAGQTYYISFDLATMHILPAAEGEAVISKASRYIELTDKEKEKAAGKIAKKWPELREQYADRLSLTATAVQRAAAPPPAEGLIKVAAGTPIVAELMENVNSDLNEDGADVWLRTAEDVHVSGKLFVAAGTPIKAVVRGVEHRGHWRKGGKLDIMVVSVTGADGAACPLIGQMAGTGTRGSGVGTGAAIAAGSIGGVLLAEGLTRGRQAFYAAGATVKVFTRDDTWIKPVAGSSEPKALPVAPANLVKAYVRGKLVCDFAKAKVPETVEIVFENARDLAKVELVHVAESGLPTPVTATTISAANDGAVAQFGGWDLSRFLRPDTPTPMSFRLTTTAGEVRTARAELAVASK